MAKTPTVHNPTHFDPSQYEVEDYLDNKRPEYFGQPVEAWEAEIASWKADMLATFGPDWIKKVHHCIHCGNGNVRWITAVRHLPTDEVVVFGSDCTARLGFADRHAFKLAQLQSRDATRKVRIKVWHERQAFLEAHPEVVAAIAAIDSKDPVHAKNWFVQDVLRKLDQYGSLSAKQVAAVVSSLQRDRDQVARKAAEAVEVKGDAPTGRIAVTGTVLSMKVQDGAYGPQHKMLVKLENNSKVWVTVPSKGTIERGDTITVKATWTPSRDDKSFGFGSRPTLVNRIPAGEWVSPKAVAALPAKHTDPTMYGLASGRYEGLDPLKGGEEASDDNTAF